MELAGLHSEHPVLSHSDVVVESYILELLANSALVRNLYCLSSTVCIKYHSPFCVN